MTPSKKPYVTRMVAVVAAVAVALGGYAWLDAESDRLDAMAVRRLGRGGRVEIVRHGDVVTVRDMAALATGDVVRTSGAARARVRLEGRRDAWLAPASEAVVAGGDELEVRSGGVLVRSDDPTTVAIGDVDVRPSMAVVRVDALDASARVASYRGDVALAAPGRPEVVLEPLFQVATAAGELAAARPYRLDPSDAWDRTRLAPVVELHERLTRVADRIAAAGARPAAPVASLRARRPADAAIAVALARTAAAPFGAALRRALDLRDSGGQWAVVAAIMDVGPRALVAELGGVVVAAGVADPAAAAADGPHGVAPGGAGTATDAPAASAPDAPSSGASGPPPATGGTRTDDPVDGGGDDDGGGGGGGGGDDDAECDNEVDCILPVLPTPPSLLDDLGGGG
ncbi:MAG TPA: hypothetical protein VHJ34_13150 [Actinomycetota bacterium]|nr:hypothetical protein [Actinomycetota bacterium]